MSCLVKATGITRAYGDAVILDGVDFEARAGSSVALVGASGSGKSTLLSILGLLLTPTSGTVEIDGMAVTGLTDDEVSRLRQRTIGFVYQHAQLIGSLRAWENVAVPARFLVGESKMSKADIKEKAHAMLAQFGLGDRCGHYPYQLSIGQKRRIALARALFLDPPVIIADEPTNDLDAANSEGVASALFEKAEQGCVLMFATHDDRLYRRADIVYGIEQAKLKRLDL